MNITKIIATVTSCAVTVASFAATAAQAQEARVIQVDTSDVNFANPASVSRLQSRIEVTAKRACRAGDSGELNLRMEARKCYSNAVADASSQIEQRVAKAQSQPNGQSLAISTRTPK